MDQTVCSGVSPGECGIAFIPGRQAAVGLGTIPTPDICGWVSCQIGSIDSSWAGFNPCYTGGIMGKHYVINGIKGTTDEDSGGCFPYNHD